MDSEDLSVDQRENTRRVNHEYFHKAGSDAHKQANTIYFDLVRLFITIASGILVLTGPLIGNNDFLLSAAPEEKVILIISWAFCILSILAGFIQLRSDRNFFIDNGDNMFERSNLFIKLYPNKETLIQAFVKSELLGAKYKKQSDERYLLIQSVFVILAFIGVLVIGIIRLY